MKALMICLGNICRSPMAEGILRHRAKERGIQLELDSCGTNGLHNGEQADRRARATLDKKGIDISDLRSRQITRSDFDEFDELFVMDHSNLKNVLSLAQNADQEQKVKLFLNEAFPGEDRQVPDPYYGGDEGFESVYQMLSKAADNFLDRIS